jgi:hypothetical protein
MLRNIGISHNSYLPIEVKCVKEKRLGLKLFLKKSRP